MKISRRMKDDGDERKFGKCDEVSRQGLEM